MAIIYITHRLDEVFQIADRVQVLRDGDTSLLADVERDRTGASLIEAMVGRRLAELPRPAPLPPHADATEVIRWTGAASGAAFADVSLGVYKGEIVALYGKLGSGASEVAETAFGLAPADGRDARGQG